MNKIFDELKAGLDLNTDARNTIALVLSDLVKQVGED